MSCLRWDLPPPPPSPRLLSVPSSFSLSLSLSLSCCEPVVWCCDNICQSHIWLTVTYTFPLPELSISKPIGFYIGTCAFFHLFLPRVFQRKSWNWNGWSGIPHVPSTVLCLHARFQTRQNQFDELLEPTIHVLYVLRRFRNECLRKYTSTTAFTVFETTYPTTIVWRTQL